METLLNHLAQALNDNLFLAYLGVFIGGVLSSSSPCVLATIPLVIGYVGGYSEGDRRKALFYSLTFILGLSIRILSPEKNLHHQTLHRPVLLCPGGITAHHSSMRKSCYSNPTK